MSPGFHIGLCPHFTLGYAGVPPLQGSLSYWAFGVLCRGIVFVKCVWVCKWIVAFVFLYLIVIVLFVVLRGGLIVAVGQRAPRGRYSCKAQGASPGLIIVTHLFSPVGAALPYAGLCVVVMLYCIYPLGYLLAWVSAAPTELILLLLVYPQGSISGFALISPWAMQECRPFRALCRIGRLRSCVVVLCSLYLYPWGICLRG